MKRFLIELIGTFFLTLAIALTGNPLCYGLIFAAVNYLGAHISDGYYNPAVTVALCLHGKHKKDHMLHLLFGQLAGAMLALFLSMRATGQGFALPADASRISMACLSEILLTFLLCAVILSINAQKIKEVGGLVIGFTLMGLGYIGGMFNPAISFASQLLNVSQGNGFDVNSMLVYFICPLIGGALAAITFKHYQE